MDQSNYDSNFITWLRVFIEHTLIQHFFFFARISKWEEFTKLGTKCPRQYYLITTAKSCYIKQVQSIMVNLICTKFLHIFPLAFKKGPFGNNTPKILKLKKKKKKKNFGVVLIINDLHFKWQRKSSSYSEWEGKFKIKATQTCKINSRYLKPIYAKPDTLNKKTSNQNPLIKTKSNPSI